MEPVDDPSMDAQHKQEANRRWWTRNAMAYDWTSPLSGTPLSPEWFHQADERMVQGSRLFASRENPFDVVIPLSGLAGKDVLEIGCGLGFHTELMIRAGGKVISADLSESAVIATQARLRIKQLPGSVLQGDAEDLPFPTNSFDLVWSWGVIHHSTRTGRVVREIGRVLRPAGECRLMVYNRDSTAARAILIRHHLLKRKYKHQTLDETLNEMSDGARARFYTKDQFHDLLSAFFERVNVRVYGQDADVVPLPAKLRGVFLQKMSGDSVARALEARGSFLFATVSRPY